MDEQCGETEEEEVVGEYSILVPSGNFDQVIHK